MPFLGFSRCSQSQLKRCYLVGGALLWGKEGKRSRIPSRCVTVWKERNRLAFRGGSLVIQKLKNSFVCNLWSWARVYIGEESSLLLGFLEWLVAT